MKKIFAEFSRRLDLKLLIIFILLSTSILIKSYSSHTGYLSPDSTRYLGLAQNMLNGNSLYMEDFLNESGRSFYAIFPAGYPTLIYLTAKFSGLNVFLASKIFNIICVMFSLIIFRIVFKNEAYVFGSIFFLSSYIEIFSYTWSEAPFIFSLLFISVSLYFFTQNRNNLSLVFIFVSSLLAFFSRYIGFFTFIVIGSMGCLFLYKKAYKTSLKLFLVSISGIFVAAIYLYNNFLKTGFITGTSREFIFSESFIKQFIMSVQTHFVELSLLFKNNGLFSGRTKSIIYLISMIIGGVVIVYIFAIIKKKNLLAMATKNKSTDLCKIFLYVGFVYWISIISLKWLFHFDNLNWRLLGPATFLVILSILSFFKFTLSKYYFKRIKRIFMLIAVFSFLINVPLRSLYSYYINKKISYFDTIKIVKQRYDFF